MTKNNMLYHDAKALLADLRRRALREGTQASYLAVLIHEVAHVTARTEGCADDVTINSLAVALDHNRAIAKKTGTA